ncbi:MAG: right-handed parallel beta-helix repeat-containing protein [Nanoarchaeota archaeon]|nr:right-handed parallel beta-helix repeat-containing protein [Nanoarchaeota archaeon]
MEHTKALWGMLGVVLLLGSMFSVLAAPTADAQLTRIKLPQGSGITTTGPATAIGGTTTYTEHCGDIASCNQALAPNGNSQPKIVYLDNDITGVVGNGIVISRNKIVFDGQGHTITGTSDGQSGDIGISTQFRDAVTIQNIEVTNFDLGVSAEQTSNLQLLNNKINNNNWIGASVGGGSLNNIKILNNEFQYNGYQALVVSPSINIEIRGNFIYQNNAVCDPNYPVRLNTITDSIITENTIKYNNNGIELYNGYNNLIYHNNFILNGYDVNVVGGSDNAFSLPYDSQNPKNGGGNHWALIGGGYCTDLYDGPDVPQTTGSPDGICDDGHTNGASDPYAFVYENGWI